MRNFKELKIWQLSFELTKAIHRITLDFPESERFGLTNQVRRSAVSIPANISEGCGRNSNDDFKRFLSIAQGSAFETETHLLLAHGFGYIKDEDMSSLIEQVNEVQRTIGAFIRALK